MAISEYTHTYFGVDVLMHLTCTNMKTEELKQILTAARSAGKSDILESVYVCECLTVFVCHVTARPLMCECVYFHRPNT